MTTAKLFWNGRSQAVRLPKEFRFDTTEVTIRREGDAVILEKPHPSADDWDWLNDLTAFDDDVLEATKDLDEWGPDDPEAASPK